MFPHRHILLLQPPPPKKPPSKRNNNHHRSNTPNYNTCNRAGPEPIIPRGITIFPPIRILKQCKLILPRRAPSRRTHVVLWTPRRIGAGVRCAAAYERHVGAITRVPVITRNINAIIRCEAVEDGRVKRCCVDIWARRCIIAVGITAWVGRAAAHEIGGVRTGIPCSAGWTGEGAGF